CVRIVIYYYGSSNRFFDVW
nr:immunoglobulin heavy chain junction region [Mus musculus]